MVFQARFGAEEELTDMYKVQNLERVKLFKKDVHERASAKRILHAKIDTVKLLDKLKLESAEWNLRMILCDY